jgi:hypothetical protein
MFLHLVLYPSLLQTKWYSNYSNDFCSLYTFIHFCPNSNSCCRLSGKWCPSPCTVVPLNPQITSELKDQEIIQPRTRGSILQSGLMDIFPQFFSFLIGLVYSRSPMGITNVMYGDMELECPSLSTCYPSFSTGLCTCIWFAATYLNYITPCLATHHIYGFFSISRAVIHGTNNRSRLSLFHF